MRYAGRYACNRRNALGLADIGQFTCVCIHLRVLAGRVLEILALVMGDVRAAQSYCTNADPDRFGREPAGGEDRHLTPRLLLLLLSILLTPTALGGYEATKCSPRDLPNQQAQLAMAAGLAHGSHASGVAHASAACRLPNHHTNTTANHDTNDGVHDSSNHRMHLAGSYPLHYVQVRFLLDC